VRGQAACVALVLTCAAAANADVAANAESPATAYAAAVSALAKGADNEAIDRLELLADQGFRHPDASLARAAAYLARAEGSGPRAGDLGRAAAALTETLLLRPGDTQAERALDAVQAEIARRKARQGASVVVRPRLLRAVTSLLPEQVWAAVAALGSLVLALGIAARRLSKRALSRLSGNVAIAVGAVVVLVFAAGAYAARSFRISSRPAVVVVSDARLLDGSGRRLPTQRGNPDSTTAPEGAMVYVLEETEGRCRVEWGNTEGWLSRSDVQLLARP
jgi:hypothetical protein